MTTADTIALIAVGYSGILIRVGSAIIFMIFTKTSQMQKGNRPGWLKNEIKIPVLKLARGFSSSNVFRS